MNNILKPIVFVFFLGAASLSLFAQQEASAEDTAQEALNSESILNRVTASTNVKEISLHRFENMEFWRGKMAPEDGLIFVKNQLSSGPEERTPLPGEEANNISSEERYILGAKVKYFRRNVGTIEIIPARPIPIEGVVKQISLWVASRNHPHKLKIVVRDLENKRKTLYMGSLAFNGWQQLVATVPPTMKQIDYRDPRIKSGLIIEKLLIQSDLADSYGEFYVYFDDLRARSDLYHIEGFDQADNPSDNW